MAMKVKRQQVFCTTRFIGFHFWKDAPNSVAFLRDPHRHEFHVKVTVVVSHSDRAVEFITLKRAVDVFIHNRQWCLMKDDDIVYMNDEPVMLGPLANSFETAYSLSCEQIADAIGQHLRREGYAVKAVEVSEDGENGGKVIYELED